MKKIYKKFLCFLMNIPVKIENLKTTVFEWYAIFRKRNLYKDIKWSKSQQREFETFWKSNYGRKISNRWHRLYQSMNGVYRFDYVPEILYTTKIEHNRNDFYYGKVFSDKTMLGVLFDNRIPDVRAPRTYVANSFGVFYDSEHRVISKKEATAILFNIGECVIKPTVDSSSGDNIQLLDLRNGINIKDQRTVEGLFEAFGTNFVIQEKVQPHVELKKIYPHSINTFRITSYLLGSEVHVAPVALRVGSGGGTVDNIHAGGIGIAVNDDGTLNDLAYKLGFGDKTETFSSHPDTGIVFKDVKFSFVDKLISSAKSLHGILSNIGVISWDFTVDSNGDIVVIEANLRGQGVWFPQIISGKSLFGENSGEYLRQLKKRC